MGSQFSEVCSVQGASPVHGIFEHRRSVDRGGRSEREAALKRGQSHVARITEMGLQDRRQDRV